MFANEHTVIDANGWAVIIAAAGVVLGQALQMILSYLREGRTAAKLSVIEKQTNGDLAKHTAEAAAEVVVKVAEKTAESLVNTATAVATTAATATATAVAAAAAAATAAAAAAEIRNKNIEERRP